MNTKNILFVFFFLLLPLFINVRAQETTSGAERERQVTASDNSNSPTGQKEATAGNKNEGVFDRGKEIGADAIDLTKRVAKKTGGAVLTAGEKTDRVNATIVATTKEAGIKTKRVAGATAAGVKDVTVKTAEVTGDAVETTAEGTKKVSRKTAALGTTAGRKTQSVGRTVLTRLKKFGLAVKDVFTP